MSAVLSSTISAADRSARDGGPRRVVRGCRGDPLTPPASQVKVLLQARRRPAQRSTGRPGSAA